MKDTFFKNLRLIREEINQINEAKTGGEIRANYLARHDVRNDPRNLVRSPLSSARNNARRARDVYAGGDNQGEFNTASTADTASKTFAGGDRRGEFNTANRDNIKPNRPDSPYGSQTQDIVDTRNNLRQASTSSTSSTQRRAAPANRASSTQRPAASKTPMTVSGYAKQRAAITSKNLGGQPSVAAGRRALAKKTLNTTGGGAKGNMARQRAQRDLYGPVNR